MGKKSPTPPAAPNYQASAAEQGAANLKAAQQSAYLSNPNIYTPFGNQTVTWDTTNPDMPQATVRQTLTPEAQTALEAQQKVDVGLSQLGLQGLDIARNALGQPMPQASDLIQSIPGAGEKLDPFAYGRAAGLNAAGVAQMAGLFGTPQQQLDLSGIAKMPVNAGTTGQEAIMARLAPQLERERAAAAQRLANQGIRAGSEAYRNYDVLQSQRQNDLLSQAALQGLNLDIGANQQGFNQALAAAELYNQGLGQNVQQNLAAQGLYNQSVGQNFNQALQAMNQNFNQAMQGAQFTNAARQAQYAQALAQRQAPINEITALMSGSQIQLPQFQSYTGQNVAANPVFQAAQLQNQYNMDVYGQQMAARNAAMQGLGSAVGGIAGMFNPFKFGGKG